ncbi:MAG: hypothetical protein Q4G40_06960, partial [Brachybacterium sp.]|nr:hypothetical protein [Brachybacterium sp.]
MTRSRTALDPAIVAGWEHDHPARKGFFTDTSICIGCKACEVACKEWNMLPMDGLGMTGESYDNTTSLGANTWRHVAFVEQGPEEIARARAEGARLVDLGMPTLRSAVESPPAAPGRPPVDLPEGPASDLFSSGVPAG